MSENETNYGTESVEQEIQRKGLTAPRVTPADIEANIAHTEIVKRVSPSGRVLRWAVLTTRNGFAVTGEPSCAVSPANDDAELGEKLAIENAKDRLWALMGYALSEKLSRLPELRELIARVAHEVNRAYCCALGDLSQSSWENTPQWQRDSALVGVDLHLGNPNLGPEASHESWMAHKLEAGWTHGAAKDPEAKTHPCLVPFSELPREQQAKDFLFRAVVHALAPLGVVER